MKKKRYAFWFFCLTVLILIINHSIGSDDTKGSAKPEKPTVKKAQERCPAPTIKKGEKIAYLTFDDGPSQYTERIVQTLNEKKAGGTFFFIGNRVEQRGDMVDAVKKTCHAIGLHTMTHQYQDIYRKENGFTKENLVFQELIKTHYQLNVSLTRAPYGSTYLKKEEREEMKRHELKLWDWTVDSMDWKLRNANDIVRTIQSQLNGDTEVILLHELPSTLDALPSILSLLEENGYRVIAYHPNNHIAVNFSGDPDL